MADETGRIVNKERIKTNINLLIHGYVKAIQSSIFNQIPNEIIQLLVSFICIDFCFVVAIRCHSQSSEIMKIFNMNDDCSKIYNSNIHFTGIKNGFSTSFKSQARSNCVASNCILPTCMETKCDEKYGNKLINRHKLLSNPNWNLIFNFYNDIYHITAFNKSFYKYSNHNNNKVFEAFNYEIPRIMDDYPSSFTYNITKQTLYTISNSRICHLNLNKNSNLK